MVAWRCVVTSMCLSARSGDTKHLDPIGDGLRFFKKSRRCVPFVHIPKEGDVEMNALLQDLQVGKKKKQPVKMISLLSPLYVECLEMTEKQQNGD